MNSWLEAGLSNALVATALALTASAVSRVFRRPQVAFVLWLLVLAKLIMPPLVGVPVVSFENDTPRSLVENSGVPANAPPIPPPKSDLIALPDASFDSENGGAHREDAQVAETIEGHFGGRLAASGPLIWSRITPFVFWAWAVGSGLWFTLAAIRIVRFYRVLRHAGRAAPELQDEVGRLAVRIGLRSVPRVRLVNRHIPPLVWAMLGKATILLPAKLVATLTAGQRTTLLAHELAHLARRDHLVRWLELMSLGLYWWHPVAWWARRNLAQAEEHCCDAHVIRFFPELRRAYAEAMVATVEFLAESRPAVPLGASGFSQLHSLTRRMEMILDDTVIRRANWPLRLALLLLAVLALPLSICTLRAESTSPNEKVVAKPDVVEQRLDRLEKMIETLASEMRESRNLQAQPVKPAVATSASSPAVKKNEKTSSESKLQSALGGDVDEELALLVRTAQIALQRSMTSDKLSRTAEIQAEAMKTAYEAGAVTVDQVLEAQRRCAEARTEYVRTVAGLYDNPGKRHYLLARGALSASNKALREAHTFWAELHRLVTAGDDSSPAAKVEAQAREQYFQFKSQTQLHLGEVLRRKAALDAGY